MNQEKRPKIDLTLKAGLPYIGQIEIAIGNIESILSFFRAKKKLEKIKKDVFEIGKMRIEEPCTVSTHGVIVPLSLIIGNLTSYEDDWKMCLERIDLDFDTEYPLDSIRKWMYYSWMMWGPSVDINAEDTNHKYLQIGLGDECNSIPLVFSYRKWLIFKKCCWQQVLKGDITGLLVPLSVIKNTDILPQNKLHDFRIYEKFDRLIYVGDGEDYFFEPIVEETVPYYSAYLWAIFVDSEREEKVFPVYEHVNLADNITLEFYRQRLLQKIRALLDQSKEKGISLIYYVGLNSEMDDLIKNTFQMKPKVSRKHLFKLISR
jgi:hypothetical protein